MSLLKHKRLNILVSYAYLQGDEYFTDLLLQIAPYANILIDSGAHTNRQIMLKTAIGKKPANKEVTLDAYHAFLKKVDGKVWQYIALDVIRNPQKTNENLAASIAQGFKPMPVFIEGYTQDDLDRIMQINPRLCVAGAVGSSDAYIHDRYQKVFEMSGQRAKIHGLGYGRYPEIKAMPIYSADSSSFNSGSRYGIMFVFNKEKGITSFKWKQLVNKDKDAAFRRLILLEYLTACGVTPEMLKTPVMFKGAHNLSNVASMMSYYAYLLLMDTCSQHEKDYFLAISTNVHYMVGIAATIRTEHEGGTSFDYPAARELAIQYEKRGDKQIAFVVETLKEHTEWAMAAHSQ